MAHQEDIAIAETFNLGRRLVDRLGDRNDDALARTKFGTETDGQSLGTGCEGRNDIVAVLLDRVDDDAVEADEVNAVPLPGASSAGAGRHITARQVAASAANRQAKDLGSPSNGGFAPQRGHTAGHRRPSKAAIP